MNIVNISIENNEIRQLCLNNDKLKEIYNITLNSTINNIADIQHIKYNLDLQQDSLKYLDSYIGCISNTMFSLNAFLIKTMIEFSSDYDFYSILEQKNEEKHKLNICEYSNNSNTVGNLIYYFVAKNIIPLSLLEFFAQFETIFRNQQAHGWNLFFYAFLEEMENLETKFNYSNYNDYNYILTNSNGENHKKIRKDLKVKSLNYKEINLIPYVEENSSTSFHNELNFKLKAEYDPNYILALKKHGIDTTIKFYPCKFINDESRIYDEQPSSVHDLLDDFILKQANKEKITYILSLNNLYTKIYGLLNELDINICNL